MEAATFAIRDYYVMLAEMRALDADELVDALRGVPITRAEVILAARRQRGFLFGRQSEELATAVADALARVGIEAVATPAAELPDLRKARSIQRMEVIGDGIYLPGLASIGANGFVAAESIRLLSAGLITRQSEVVISEREREMMLIDQSGAVSKQIAQRSVKAYRERVFPLSEYLLRAPEETVNYDRLKSQATPKEKGKRPIIDRYRALERDSELPRYLSSHPDLTGRLLLVTDQGAHMLNAESAIFERRDESVFGHWVRAFQPLVIEAATALARAHGSTNLPAPDGPHAIGHRRAFLHGATLMPPETLDLAQAFDSGSYLFDDVDAFTEHAQWWLMNGRFIA